MVVVGVALVVLIAAGWLVMTFGKRAGDLVAGVFKETPATAQVAAKAPTSPVAPPPSAAPAPQAPIPAAPSPAPETTAAQQPTAAPLSIVVQPPVAPPVAQPAPAVVVPATIPPPAREVASMERKEPPREIVESPPAIKREPVPASPPRVAAAIPEPKGNISIARQAPQTSPRERAATEYRNGVELVREGQVDQAIVAFNAVLVDEPRHFAARQTNVTLMLERGRTAEAQASLRQGLAVLPENAAWAMLLARLQVEDGDAPGAIDTLQKSLPHARDRADYQAFLGTVLQMQSRHKEAIQHYEVATRLAPTFGAWQVGLAISLEEEKRMPEAFAAYERAYASPTLAPSVRTFVEAKLKNKDPK